MAVNQVIVEWVARQVGQRVGNGQCWTLAENALRHAHAQTSNDIMGADGVNSDADYLWGREVQLNDIIPGDIVQFRSYTCTYERVYATDGSWTEAAPKRRGEPRHTAIVKLKGINGAVTIYEQNVPSGRGVTIATLYFDNAAPGVSLGGYWWFYRPIPKP